MVPNQFIEKIYQNTVHIIKEKFKDLKYEKLYHKYLFKKYFDHFQYFINYFDISELDFYTNMCTKLELINWLHYSNEEMLFLLCDNEELKYLYLVSIETSNLLKYIEQIKDYLNEAEYQYTVEKLTNYLNYLNVSIVMILAKNNNS
jgi:hypothetical protein